MSVLTPTLPTHRERHLLLAGPAYTALLVVAAALFPSPSGGDVAAGLDPGWLAQHVDAVIGQVYVRALACLAFILLALAVGRLCSLVTPTDTGRHLARVAAAGGVSCGALMLAAQAAALAAALLAAAGGGPDAVRALGALDEGLLDLSSLPAVLLFAVTGATILRSAAPHWLGWLSLLGVPLALLDAASFDGGPFAALGFVGLVYFLLWALLAGVQLHRLRLPGQATKMQNG